MPSHTCFRIKTQSVCGYLYDRILLFSGFSIISSHWVFSIITSFVSAGTRTSTIASCLHIFIKFLERESYGLQIVGRGPFPFLINSRPLFSFKSYNYNFNNNRYWDNESISYRENSLENNKIPNTVMVE